MLIYIKKFNCQFGGQYANPVGLYNPATDTFAILSSTESTAYHPNPFLQFRTLTQRRFNPSVGDKAEMERMARQFKQGAFDGFIDTETRRMYTVRNNGMWGYSGILSSTNVTTQETTSIVINEHMTIEAEEAYRLRD